MRIKNKLILLLVLLAAQDIWAQQSRFNIEEAVEYATEHSYDARAAYINESLTKNRTYEVLTEGLPKINGKIEYINRYELPTSLIPGEFVGGAPGTFVELQFGTPHNMDIVAEATQLIIDGRYFVGLKATKKVSEVAELQREFDMVGIRENVKKAYFAVLASRESVDMLVESYGATEKLWFETKALYENGFVEQLDVDRLELAKSNLQSEIDNANREAKNALNALKFLMGYDMSKNIILTDSLSGMLNAKDQVVSGVDPGVRLEYKMLEAQVKLRKYDIMQQTAGYFPSVYAFGTYGFNAQRNEFNFFGDEPWFSNGMVGVTVNVPIFDGLTKSASIQKARLRLQETENQVNQFESALEVEYEQASNNYLNANRKLENAKKNLDLARKIRNISALKYKEGVGSSLELTSAESDFVQAQLTYTQSLYNLLVSKVSLQKVAGEL